MGLDLKSIGVGAAIAFVAAGAGHWLSSRNVETAAADRTPRRESPLVQVPEAPPAAPPAATAGAAQRSLPSSHPPPSAVVDAPPAREGKVGADPAARFVHFRTGNRNVKDLLVDGKVLWAGTSGGLVRYDTRDDRFRLFDNTNGLLSNGIFHVGRLDGRIVVGTYGGGMALYDEKADRWETFNVPEGLGDAFVYDVLKARNGDVWIATWSGVNRVRGGALRDRRRWELHTVDSTGGGLPNDWVYALAEGRDGAIWLATEGGLARYAGGRWEHWNHAKGLGAPYERVKNDIAFDSDPAKVSSHHERQKREMGLAGIDVAYNPNYVVALAVDRAGTVWAGTWGGGLSRFDGRRWTHYTTTDGLPGNHVFMLHVDARGRLWIGTNNGLARRTDAGFETMTVRDGLFANNVFSMASDAAGNLWVGSFGGVARIQDPTTAASAPRSR